MGDEFLLFQTIQARHPPSNPWSAVQKETVRTFHPGVTRVGNHHHHHHQEDCMFCKLRLDEDACTHTANALAVLVNRNALVAKRKMGQSGHARSSSSSSVASSPPFRFSHPRDKLPADSVLLKYARSPCMITMDRLDYIYRVRHEQDDQHATLDHCATEELYVPDSIKEFVTVEQFAYDDSSTSDVVRCANTRRCVVYEMVSEGVDTVNDVIFDRRSKGPSVYRHCPVSFTCAYVKNMFPIVCDPHTFNALFAQYGQDALEYIHVYHNNLCFCCAMSAMQSNMLSCLRDSTRDPKVAKQLGITAAIHKALCNKLHGLGVVMQPLDNLLLPLASTSSVRMLEEHAHRDMTVVKDVLFVNWKESFKKTCTFAVAPDGTRVVASAFLPPPTQQ